MRVASIVPGPDFPPIAPQKTREEIAPPVGNHPYPDDRRDADDRKDSPSNAKPAIGLPQLGKTPRSSRASPTASTTASPSPSSLRERDEQDRKQGLSSSSSAKPRKLVDDVSYKNTDCSVYVCGDVLKIFSQDRELASLPVQGVVARFEQEGRRVVCSFLDWEFFMLSSVSESVERIWRLQMSWTQALSFRKSIEKLGIVQTDLTAQFTFNKYIGKGAFSEVYLAQHVDTMTTVAAKVMKKPLGYPDVNVDAHVWQEFTKEVRVLQMAQGHENIMRLHGTYLFRTNDAGSGEGPCALTMITELLDISLLDLVKKSGKLPESSTKGVAESLLRAVDHLNSKGLVHRDIKVSNVMIRSLERGGIVLVDYGFGRECYEPEVFKSVVGTVGYLAPELFLENTYVDLRYVDVFSVGIVTMTCLLGRSVFQGKGKDGVATDRAKYFENQKCELNWDGPTACLTPVGLESLRSLLEMDPIKRPMAADALRSPWYDLKFEDCVPGDIPEAKQRELATITMPPFRRCSGDAAVAEKPRSASKPSPPEEGQAESPPLLKPTAPATAPSTGRPSAPGRRQTTRRESGTSSAALAAASAA